MNIKNAKNRISNNSKICQDIIKKYLDGKTTKELCKEYNFKNSNRHAILNILKKYNIPIRPEQKTHAIKYSIDLSFFEKIDSKEKSYFFGLLCADGSLSLKRNDIKISLTEEDRDILIKFNEALKSNKPLRYVKGRVNPKTKPQYSLSIERKKMCLDLANLNFPQGQNKTDNLILPFNVIPQKYHKDFIRGFFDGDGCVTQSKNSPLISFSGTKESIEQLRDFFHEILGFNKNVKIQKRFKLKDTNNGYILTYGGKNQIKKFYDYLYQDCDNLYLERKMLKLKKLVAS